MRSPSELLLSAGAIGAAVYAMWWVTRGPARAATLPSAENQRNAGALQFLAETSRRHAELLAADKQIPQTSRDVLDGIDRRTAQ